MAEVNGMRIYTNGNLVILTFEERGFLGRQTFLGQEGENLERLVESGNTNMLLVDLTGVTALPCDMLGVLVGLQNRGLEIRLFNVTDDVWMTLAATNSDRLFEVREGDLSGLLAEATLYQTPVLNAPRLAPTAMSQPVTR